ncbi:MAG: iron-containing alcohol dehydrogenase [Lentimicrobium sp.]|nr:iron-containing alcohol dehydrogenase [Lentimicrobium sp.]
MENFVAYNPTSLHFGKDVLNGLPQILNRFGKKVLLVYGTGSIQRNGLYNHIINLLKSMDAEVFEYSGIRSNPVVEDVDAAAAVGRENKVDVVLAVGGGSVIDSAKIISIAIPSETPAWNYFARRAMPRTAVPLVAVLTLAATGTEMNPFAVLSNHAAETKGSFSSPLMYPKHSFLDPQYTASVPKDYTAYGIADLIAHSLEAFFGKGEEATLSDRLVYSIILEAMEYGPELLNDLENYKLRAKIMYAATMALNGLTMHGRASGEWGVHSIGHILSLLYDVPHGASLTIVYPAWMKLMKNRLNDRIKLLGNNLFGSSTAEETIEQMELFFKYIGCPVRLSDLGGIKPDADEIYRLMVQSKAATYVHKLNEDDYREIIKLMM